MKTIASLAVAGVVAATSLATTTVTADAGGKHWQHQGNWNKGGNWHKGKSYYYPKHYRSNGWNPGAAFATGTILGLTFGALAAPTYYYPPPPAYYYPPAPPQPAYPAYYSGGPTAQHVSWCSSRYRSYNAAYNTWVGFDGYVHQCVSPF